MYRMMLVIALCAMSPANVRAASPAAGEKVASFQFLDNARVPITVWYYLPAAVEANTRVVFLLHGDSRTGREARDLGLRHARTGGFILIAPEFDESHFPGDSSSFGGMVDTTDRPRPRNEWALFIVEQVSCPLLGRLRIQQSRTFRLKADGRLQPQGYSAI